MKKILRNMMGTALVGLAALAGAGCSGDKAYENYAGEVDGYGAEITEFGETKSTYHFKRIFLKNENFRNSSNLYSVVAMYSYTNSMPDRVTAFKLDKNLSPLFDSFFPSKKNFESTPAPYFTREDRRRALELIERADREIRNEEHMQVDGRIK